MRPEDLERMSTSALADLASKSSALLAKRLTADAPPAEPLVEISADIATVDLTEVLADGLPRWARLKAAASLNDVCRATILATAREAGPGAIVLVGKSYRIDRTRLRSLG